MAYTKTVWKDRKVQSPSKFKITSNPDGTIELASVPGVVTEEGTPISADIFNNMEQGIKDNDTHIGDMAQITEGDLVSAVKNDRSQLADIAVNVKTFGAKADANYRDDSYNWFSDEALTIPATDNTSKIQAAIDYVMNKGGGRVYIPQGNYLIKGTLYTHSINLSNDKIRSPLEIMGATPCTNIPSGYKRSQLVKNTVGTLLGINYNDGNSSIVPYPDVYRIVEIHNISFAGSGGTTDSKYGDLAATLDITGIEMHLASINIHDCSFYGLQYGIYQPAIVGSGNNYCDISQYKRLFFSNIGTGFLNIWYGDTSIIEGLSGNVCPTCQYVLKIQQGSSINIKSIIVSGKNMLRATQCFTVDFDSCTCISVDGLYYENLSMTPIRVTNSTFIDFNNIYLRHYAPSYGAMVATGATSKSISFNNVHYVHVEGKRLDIINDSGDYSTYVDVAIPVDFNFTASVISVNNKKFDVSQYISNILTYVRTRLETYNDDTIRGITRLRSTTVVIAANNSMGISKACADYVCTGINDEQIINNAIASVSTIGGKIILLEGTYIISSPIIIKPNIVIEGMGVSTVIKIADNKNSDISMITYSLSVNDVTIKNLKIDGNKVNNSSGIQKGINISSCDSLILSNLIIVNIRNHGIVIGSNCPNSQIEKCKVYSCDGNGLYLYGCNGYVLINKCIVHDCLKGINIASSSRCQITNNIIYKNNQEGIVLDTAVDNNVNNNQVFDNGQQANNTYDNIQICYNSNYNNVQNNMCRKGVLANKPMYGLRIITSNCAGNLVSNNDLYDSGATSNFNDSGTGTITTAGNRV